MNKLEIKNSYEMFKTEMLSITDEERKLVSLLIGIYVETNANMKLAFTEEALYTLTDTIEQCYMVGMAGDTSYKGKVRIGDLYKVVDGRYLFETIISPSNKEAPPMHVLSSYTQGTITKLRMDKAKETNQVEVKLGRQIVYTEIEYDYKEDKLIFISTIKDHNKDITYTVENSLTSTVMLVFANIFPEKITSEVLSYEWLFEYYTSNRKRVEK